MKRGGDRVSKVNNVQLAKQSDIANMLGSSNPKGTNIGDTPLVGDVSGNDLWSEKRK
mgnify:CR=1 FL=1